MKSMKRWIPLLVLAAALMALASCGEKGGTIEVTNKTSYPIAVSVYKALDLGSITKNEKPIEVDGKQSWSFDEDASYTITVVGIELSAKPTPGSVFLSGGKTEKVTVK